MLFLTIISLFVCSQFLVECAYALAVLAVHDPEQGRSTVPLPIVTEVLRKFQRCLKLHQILVQGLGKPSALSYLLRCIVAVAVLLDNRLLRANQVRVAEVMRLSAEHDALVCLVDRVVAYQIGQGVVDSKDLPCRARQAPLQIPHNLGSTLARLSARLDRLRARCAAAPSPDDKDAVLVLRTRPQRAHSAESSLVLCHAKAQARTGTAGSAAKRRRRSTGRGTEESEAAAAVDDDEGGGADGDGEDDESYLTRPLEWHEPRGRAGDADDSDADAVVHSEIHMLCATQQEYESSDRCFSARFKTQHFDTDEVD